MFKEMFQKREQSIRQTIAQRRTVIWAMFFFERERERGFALKNRSLEFTKPSH